MRAERSNGLKRRVVVTVMNEESPSAIRVYRGGRLGLASRLPDQHVFRPPQQQHPSTPPVGRGHGCFPVPSQQH